jgi:hypothetical protein
VLRAPTGGAHREDLDRFEKCSDRWCCAGDLDTVGVRIPQLWRGEEPGERRARGRYRDVGRAAAFIGLKFPAVPVTALSLSGRLSAT